MAPEKSVRFATWRFATYTALILGLAVVYVFVATVGSVILTRWGSLYEAHFYPALDAMEAQVREGDRVVVKTFPPFQIEEMRWVSDDLLLVRGTLCKAQDYHFISAHWFYGTPGGFKVPADFEPETRSGNRGLGCQVWRNWLLKDAKSAPVDKFYADLTYRPQHNLWNVHYILGPFDIPPRNAPAVVPQPNP